MKENNYFKTKIITIITIALLTVSTMTVFLNTTVNAQIADEQPVPGPIPTGVTPDRLVETLARFSFRPRPVGVNQPILINIWIQTETLNAHQKFTQAHSVTIVKPDGSQEVITIDSYISDSTAWFEYLVEQVGTYKLTFNFLGMYFPAGRYLNGFRVDNSSGSNSPESIYYQPSSDGPYDLEVQEDIVYSWPAADLPTDYWTRPVSPEFREWWSILGNYPPTGTVGGGPIWPANTNTYAQTRYGYVPYVEGPNSAHIVWRRQSGFGGLVGGTMGYQSFWEGNKLINYHPDIIFAGRAYQDIVKYVNGQPTTVWQCYDIRTGEVYWEKDQASQLPTFIWYDPGSAEVVGAEPYFADVFLGYTGNGRMIKYNPYTGDVYQNISIAPLTSGEYVSDRLFISVQNLGGGEYRLIKWTIAAIRLSVFQINYEFTVLSNVSYPFSRFYGTQDYEAGIAVYGQANRLMTASLETGELLVDIETDTLFGTSGTPSIADHGKFAVRYNDGHWHCWDARTGQKLWVSEISSWPWGTFGTYGSTSYGGMIISGQPDAVVAINWTDGTTVWAYEFEAQFPYETPFTGSDGQTVHTWHSPMLIADGKLYAFNAEHSPDQPIKRGSKIHAINVTTGEGIWMYSARQTGLGNGARQFQGAIADGYLAISNAYDGYMYVFGKGESATTVSAPKTSIPKGTPFMIDGTVLDQSPGQPDTPCVDKDSMTLQMEYLHMQSAIAGIKGDGIITGVPVMLTAIAEDGTYVDIGTVTTDGYSGTFGKAWTPTTEGTYKIVASFEGDESYGSSSATTWIIVGPAASASIPVEPETPEIPETPETPDTPETPETPDTPDTPETPETPEIQKLQRQKLLKHP